MYRALIILLCCSCAKYQVVSEVQLNLYHLHNPKNGKIEVILTKDKLKVGAFYRLKSIKQVEIE